MKLKQEFVTHESNGENILVSTGVSGFPGMVRGNKTFGAILELLKEETTEEEIISAMKQRFDAPEGVIRRDVEKALEKLREVGAING